MYVNGVGTLSPVSVATAIDVAAAGATKLADARLIADTGTTQSTRATSLGSVLSRIITEF